MVPGANVLGAAPGGCEQGRLRIVEENEGVEDDSPGTNKPLISQGFESKRGLLKTVEAERAGFEPAVGFYPHAALAKRCFRPLSHLTGGLATIENLRAGDFFAWFARCGK